MDAQGTEQKAAVVKKRTNPVPGSSSAPRPRDGNGWTSGAGGQRTMAAPAAEHTALEEKASPTQDPQVMSSKGSSSTGILRLNTKIKHETE